MKYSVVLNNRYPNNDPTSCTNHISELFSMAQKLRGIDGIELALTWHDLDANYDFIANEAFRLMLPVISINPDYSGSPELTLTSSVPEIRKNAAEKMIGMCNLARKLRCGTVNIRYGRDGFRYPFQVKYDDVNEWFLSGVREVAAGAKNINIALEYESDKMQRNSGMPNVYSSMFMAMKTGMHNVGVTINNTHGDGENIAEAVCLADKNSMLMHIHINDFCISGNEVMMDSIHIVEYLELFYWLNKIEYPGYISVYQCSCHPDSVKAAQESIDWLKAIEKAANKIDIEKMETVLNKGDRISSSEYIRELLFG